ncbi:MAG: tyrosine-type recombinase/integrase [Pseudobdellovibrio sp.]
MNHLQPQSKKKTIYRATNEVGIRSIWDWSEKAQNYIQRKSGNRFQAIIEKNSKAYSESFGSLQDALKWRTRLKVDLERIPDAKPMSFSELYNEFLKYKKSYVRLTTFESYVSLTKHIKIFWEYQVEDINSKTIDEWLREVKSTDYREKVKMRSTRFSYLHEIDLLKLIFSYYKEYFNERYENPVRARHVKDCVFDKSRQDRNKAKEHIKYISTDDIEKLIKVYKEQAELKSDKKFFYVACLLQLRTGLRIGEVFSLDWKDINWNEGTLLVCKTVQWMRINKRLSSIGDIPKNGRNRTIHLIPEVLNELRELRNYQARISGLIFSYDGKTIPAYSSVKHSYDYAMKKAEVGYTATHIMRHSFATHFMEATSDPIALKGILGHANLKMTDKYAKVTDKTVYEGMMKFKQAISKAST